jgi:lipoate synthase
MLKVKGKRSSKQTHTKQAGVAIYTSDKVDFKPKLVRRNKKDHFILIKRTIHQENLTTVNICTECQCPIS